MTGRILIVDDLVPNAKLLEALLSSEYYTVTCVNNGFDAIKFVEGYECDLVLLDVMMPGISGFDVCRHLKANPETMHVPIVLVTALDSQADRIHGLQAGADDFLTKPLKEMELFARVKSLLRIKLLIDELKVRASVAQEIDMTGMLEKILAPPDSNDTVLIIDDRAGQAARMRRVLERVGYSVVTTDKSQICISHATEAQPILTIVSLDLEQDDGLRICSKLRQMERTRYLPILALGQQASEAKLARALELGVNDFIVRPVEQNELAARANTQLRRHRYSDFLHKSLQATMEMAVKDALTGLFNRHYMESHMASHITKAREKNTAFSILILDIDHFKSVNDAYGHDGGDEILKEFAKRVRENVRCVDLPCRLGGEEFVVLMPETNENLAYLIADRIRQLIAASPFLIPNQNVEVSITTSVGIASFQGTDDSAQKVLKRADIGLYEAKKAGRNAIVYKSAA